MKRTIEDRISNLEAVVQGIVAVVLGGLLILAVAAAFALFSMQASADELTMGAFAEQSRRTVAAEPAEEPELAPCFGSGGTGGRDMNFNRCPQMAVNAPADVIVNRNRYMLAYSRQGYRAGLFGDSEGDSAAFVERQLVLHASSDIEVSVSLGASYSKAGNAKLIAVPEVSYTRYAVKPSIMWRDDSLTLSFSFEI
jgi:hypothetical protein